MAIIEEISSDDDEQTISLKKSEKRQPLPTKAVHDETIVSGNAASNAVRKLVSNKSHPIQEK